MFEKHQKMFHLNFGTQNVLNGTYNVAVKVVLLRENSNDLKGKQFSSSLNPNQWIFPQSRH